MAARSWCAWEQTLAAGGAVLVEDDAALLARARLEAHYFVNDGFLAESQLIAHAHRLRGIPGVVVQGADDCVTPPITSEDLCAAWPDASLRLVPGAGHGSTDPEVMGVLVDALDE